MNKSAMLLAAIAAAETASHNTLYDSSHLDSIDGLFNAKRNIGSIGRVSHNPHAFTGRPGQKQKRKADRAKRKQNASQRRKKK